VRGIIEKLTQKGYLKLAAKVQRAVKSELSVQDLVGKTVRINKKALKFNKADEMFVGDVGKVKECKGKYCYIKFSDLPALYTFLPECLDVVK